MENTSDTKMTVTRLSALAHETRLTLFRLLIRQGTEGLNAGDIAKKIGVPNSTLSYHLTELEQAGLIMSRKYQRQIIYSVDLSKVNNFLSFLVENCCQSSEEDCFTFSSFNANTQSKEKIS